MEKRENGALDSVFRMFMTAVLTVIIIVMLLIGACVYQISRQASMGKAWCESVINEYEEGWDEFLEKHSDKLRHGDLFLRPSPEYKGATGDFWVKSNGEYICRYWHPFGLFPLGHEYSSKTQKWITYD